MREITEAESQLLPCPFCGGKATLYAMPETGQNDHDVYYVQCDNPQCMGKNTSLHFSSEDEAINAWNTRAKRDWVKAERSEVTAAKTMAGIQRWIDMYNEECKELWTLVDRLAQAMKERLAQQALRGWTGWQDPVHVPSFRGRLHRNADAGDWIDVANFAAFLWWHKREREKSNADTEPIRHEASQ